MHLRKLETWTVYFTERFDVMSKSGKCRGLLREGIIVIRLYLSRYYPIFKSLQCDPRTLISLAKW